ncbi:MAG: hypothetical protein OQJ81_09495, partial [Melioribacteraceae bacterium]|nr:hypothetical protein [Melioribacteraceae bacterium]
FTIKEQKEMKFLNLAAQNSWIPIKLGTAISKKGLILPIYGRDQKIDAAKIRNLASDKKNSLSKYLKALLKIDQGLKKSM